MYLQLCRQGVTFIDFIKMVDGGSQIDADVNLYFIVPNSYKSEDECTQDMWHAYNVSKLIVHTPNGL